MAPKLRLAGEKKADGTLDKTLLAYLVVFVIAATVLIVTTYLDTDSPVDVSKDFVKAVMNGDAQRIDELNYTKYHEQTIKNKWADLLKDYKYSDLIFTQSDGLDYRVHVISNDGKIKLIIDTVEINEKRYIYYLSP